MNPYRSALLSILFFLPFTALPQYTDVINSNRPGLSVSAYAVGRGVIQGEFGLGYEQRDHSLTGYESNIFSSDIALRYGLLFETLELTFDGSFQNQKLDYLDFGTQETRTDFSTNRLGLKFLLFDPFKYPERNKPNIYSWRANNVFRLSNLLPAVSIYAGANFVLGDNPFYPGEATVSPRAMVATQSKVTPRMVLISNIAYDRIGTDFPEWMYLVSLSHAFRNPKWSAFIENQGIKSDRYADILLRGGVAHLFSENFQADLALGASFKDTPSRVFGVMGVSYRLDFHQDKPKAIEDTNAGQNGGPIRKKAMKKKKKRRKNRGKGAEDVDLGPPRL